jgi:hypothetical protein
MKGAVLLCLLYPLFLFSLDADDSKDETKKEKSSIEEYNDGKIDGEMQAGQNNYGSCCWASGCASMPLGILGGGIVTIASFNSPDQPSMIPSGTSYYKKGYLEGFQNKSKSKKGHAALTGCIAGFLINAAALALIFSL